MINRNDPIVRAMLDFIRKLDLNVASSYDQIMGDMLSHMMAQTSITDINQGSVLHALLDTVAKELEKK